jgi:hypothetical protein
MTSQDWAAKSLGVVVGIPRDLLKEDYDELVTRVIRVPRDRLTTWGIALLAMALTIGYQLLPLMDALRSVTRSARTWHRPRLAWPPLIHSILPHR